jgi:D-arabinose 1-dehydrogenase-like Zn-dependent alcohol dehydrogenase
MEQIRVSTFAGPGAQPVIHTVPWPKVSSKAALIKIGACGVCGTDLHIGRSNFPGRSLSAMSSAACSSKSATSSKRISWRSR